MLESQDSNQLSQTRVRVMQAVHPSCNPIINHTGLAHQAVNLNAFGSLITALIFIIIIVLCGSTTSAYGDESTTFFESEIRPLLMERCHKCHGAAKQSSGLRIDSRASLVKGGDSGSALVPGDSRNSLLVHSVRQTGDLKMPPNGKLSKREIASLEKWIELGAPWPATDGDVEVSSDESSSHWAFENVSDPVPPDSACDGWVRNPIDAFVKARLNALGLAPAPEADRRTLLRRLTYGLTGLPPTASEVSRFVADPDPHAYGKWVDRLLHSPAFGEHWARHWLDIARYSDTKGYVYAREERHWVHAWSYRDWVVQALNDNMPYDRFLLLQLAADQVEDRAPSDLAAMGFLTLGRRFLGVNRDIIDDRIDVVCRGMLGLTVSCARCHDHKYDPIPIDDYYSLYGVFDSSSERLVALNRGNHHKDFNSELDRRQRELADKLASARQESTQRSRDRIADYLHAQQELHKYPPNGFDQIFQKTDLLPAFVRRWESYLYEANLRDDPVFIPWNAYRKIPRDRFLEHCDRETRRLGRLAHRINPVVASRFELPPHSFDEVIDRYAAVFADVIHEWEQRVAQHTKKGIEPPRQLEQPAAEELRQVLYGKDSPCVVPDEPIVHSETFFDSATCTQLWKLQGEVDRWILAAESSPPFALTLVDKATPSNPRVFLRGDPLKKGKSVQRRFLTLLSREREGGFQQGSGRLELAQQIIHPSNPLTARVIVNRVWAQHFGKGLVTTPSDFGTRASEPSHPQLLDWLVSRLMNEGWDLKKLHRRIVMSAAYRQSSTPADNANLDRAVRIDPDNRLLWRMNPRRLSFEEFWDSTLAASDQLDRRLRGKPTALLEKPYSRRRTLYAKVDRQYLPGTLRIFDFANPDLHVPKRGETTVPQQALFLMNHPLVLKRAATLAESARQQGGNTEQAIVRLFQQTLQRPPSAGELDEARQLIQTQPKTKQHLPPETAADWQYGYGELDEPRGRVVGFTPLPHFSGDAWQGGPKWPDSKLGWVRLTAKGGHPGNDRKHAAIRRWTAPRTMTIQIRSTLNQQAAPGDGIRAFIVASHLGVLAAETVHQREVEMNLESVSLNAGDTIDFLVDIGDILNSDQHEWTQTIEATDVAGGPVTAAEYMEIFFRFSQRSTGTDWPLAAACPGSVVDERIHLC